MLIVLPRIPAPRHAWPPRSTRPVRREQNLRARSSERGSANRVPVQTVGERAPTCGVRQKARCAAIATACRRSGRQSRNESARSMSSVPGNWPRKRANSPRAPRGFPSRRSQHRRLGNSVSGTRPSRKRLVLSRQRLILAGPLQPAMARRPPFASRSPAPASHPRPPMSRNSERSRKKSQTGRREPMPSSPAGRSADRWRPAAPRALILPWFERPIAPVPGTPGRTTRAGQTRR